MTDIEQCRRFYAEEVQAVCHLRSAVLVEALASVPREAFLRPGPWLVKGEGDLGGGPWQTPDANPRHVYHNVSVAIDVERQLFNGAPGVVATMIDALELGPAARVLHVGCGLGYYAAVLAHSVGPAGRVLALEVDPELAAEARRHLHPWRQVEVRQDDASRPFDESFDAMLFSAGVTHPHDHWLAALATGGRLVLPLTVTMGPPSSPIGKGIVLSIQRSEDADSFPARVLTFIAIYSAVGVRDAAIHERLRGALARTPWPRIARLRRDAHESAAACWLHGDTFCLAST